jgi:hypothetical protein
MAGLATRKFIGSKHTALGASVGKSRSGSPTNKLRYPYYVVCIRAAGYEGSLYIGKIYRVVRPLRNDLSSELRVIDEEGEDYLYSADRFVPIEIPPKVRRALAAAG